MNHTGIWSLRALEITAGRFGSSPREDVESWSVFVQVREKPKVKEVDGSGGPCIYEEIDLPGGDLAVLPARTHSARACQELCQSSGFCRSAFMTQKLIFRPFCGETGRAEG